MTKAEHQQDQRSGRRTLAVAGARFKADVVAALKHCDLGAVLCELPRYCEAHDACSHTPPSVPITL